MLNLYRENLLAGIKYMTLPGVVQTTKSYKQDLPAGQIPILIFRYHDDHLMKNPDGNLTEIPISVIFTMSLQDLAAHTSNHRVALYIPLSRIRVWITCFSNHYSEEDYHTLYPINSIGDFVADSTKIYRKSTKPLFQSPTLGKETFALESSWFLYNGNFPEKSLGMSMEDYLKLDVHTRAQKILDCKPITRYYEKLTSIMLHVSKEVKKHGLTEGFYPYNNRSLVLGEAFPSDGAFISRLNHIEGNMYSDFRECMPSTALAYFWYKVMWDTLHSPEPAIKFGSEELVQKFPEMARFPMFINSSSDY